MSKAHGILVLLATAGAVAFGQENPCTLAFERLEPLVWRATPGGRYDPLDTFEHRQRVDVVVRGRGEGCSFTVGLAAPLGGGSRRILGSRDPLLFVVASESGQPLRDLPDAPNAALLTGDIEAGGGRATVAFEWTLPAGQAVQPGRYSGDMTFSLYNGRPPEARLSLQQVVSLSVEVASSVELLVPMATWSLGELTTGARRSVQIGLRGNAATRLSITSSSGGRLVSTLVGADSSIPYSVRLDGHANLLTPGVWERQLSPSSSLEREVELEVELGSTQGVAAGAYADTLTLTVAAE